MQQTPTFSIREDQQVSVNFGTIRATDADLPGPNSEIFYYITSEGLNANYYIIESEIMLGCCFLGGTAVDTVGVVAASGLVFLRQAVVSIIIV